MNKLEELTKRYFEDHLGISGLLEMIEEAVGDPSSPSLSEDERKTKFSAARFYKTALKSFEAPTEQAGKLGTEERQRFQKYIARNVVGETLSDKIDSMNLIAAGSIDGDPRISEIMGALGAVKMLQQTLDDFNESTAGFLFEAFLSGLLGGKQVTDRVGGTLPIEDCMFFVDPKTGEGGQPVSLKLLNPRTSIEGSLVNLLDFFARDNIAPVAEQKGIEYIVATKTARNELDVYSFNIKPSNFFYWIKEKHFDLYRYAAAEEPETIMERLTPKEVDQKKADWESFFLGRSAMFGLDPGEVTFNYDWKSASYWRNVIKPPSSSVSGKAAQERVKRVAEIILSDDAKVQFAKWKRSDLMLPEDLEQYEIGKLELEFRSEDPQISLQGAKKLAVLGKARLIAYYDSIEGVQAEKFREAPNHIQRWWATNKRGGQHVESDVVARLKAIMKTDDDKTPPSAEQVQRWSRTLKGLLSEAQFHIHPNRVRSEGTYYGTVDVNKKKIYRSLQRYSAQLEELCFPIYDELERLTTYINGFYLQNRVRDAFKASDSAERLSRHADKLAAGTVDSPAAPEIEYAPATPKTGAPSQGQTKLYEAE